MAESWRRRAGRLREAGRTTRAPARACRTALRLATRQLHRLHAAEQRRRCLLAALFRDGAAGAATRSRQEQRPRAALRQGRETVANPAAVTRRPRAAALTLARRSLGWQCRFPRRRHAGYFRSR